MRRISSLAAARVLLISFVAIGCAAAGGPAGAGPTTAPATAGSAQAPDEDFPGGDQPSGPVAQAGDLPLVIHTGSINLEVTDMRASIDRATSLIASVGGQVAESHQENEGEYQAATVTYRIPAQRWDEALIGLRGLGQKVLAEDTDSSDVTAQVVDLDARIANLQASESALQAIMARATTIADVLKVQQELSAVRGDIESMIAQRDTLSDQAAMGTLDVIFTVPVVAAAVASNGWDLGREVDNAVAALLRVTQVLTSLAVWIGIVITPVVLPVLLVIWLAVRVRRRVEANRSREAATSV